MDDLPGTPFYAKLTCPSCGWKFELGLRKMAELDVENDGEELACTCCSKCLANIEFKVDGSDARVITPERLAAMDPRARQAVEFGHYMAWLAQHINRGPLQ